MEAILKKLQSFLKSSILACFLTGTVILIPSASDAKNSEDSRKFEGSITDYRSSLNPRFNKTIRRSTKFIVVHTSECNLTQTLKIVSEGKQDNGRWTSRGGHAHYVIAPDGTIFRILDEKYRANHVGLSMWNGITKLNYCSVGIELVGYHNKKITESQYESVKYLIQKLKTKYQLQDRAVLTHSQVA